MATYTPGYIPTVIQTNQVISIPATAITYNISAADSGKTFLIPALGAALTINLPNVSPGLMYRFMTTDILGQIATLIPTNGLAPYTPILGLITGSLFNIGDTTADGVGALGVNEIVNDHTYKNADNTVRFIATAVTGDFVDIISNGNAWYVSGFSGQIYGLE